MKEGKKQHEDVLTDYIEDLECEGYRVIRLKGKSPDAIAVRYILNEDNLAELEISAVEVLGKTHRKGRGWHGSWTRAQKQRDYDMFDKVLIRTFKRTTNYQKGGPPYLRDEE